MEQTMRIVFNDGKPDFVCPYTPQNVAIYNRNLHGRIKELILETPEKKPAKIDLPPPPPKIPGLMSENGGMVSQKEIDDRIQKGIADALSKMNLHPASQPKKRGPKPKNPQS